MIDLHTHTEASDGELSPEALVKLAQKKKLKGLCVTDHDTIVSQEEVRHHCKQAALEWISGIEISCHHQEHEIHVLAYGFSLDAPELASFLKAQQQKRISRLQQMLQQLQKAEVLIELSDVLKQGGNSHILGRAHVAKALVRLGYAPNSHIAFQRYLVFGKAGFVPSQFPEVLEVLSLLQHIKAISILAHPALISSRPLQESLWKLPFDGLELIHPSHRRSDQTQLQYVATQREWLTTGGSDFHSQKDKKRGGVGYYSTPESSWNKMKQRLASA